MLPVSIFLGVMAGLFMGLLGVGGGVIIVPGLIYLAGFSASRAVGTSLAVLLPPVGIAAAWEYYRRGDVDLKAAMVMAVTVMLTAWLAAFLAEDVPDVYVRIIFGLAIIILGVYMVVQSAAGLFH
ncbi:MAG TPA: TSUP family transporter [Smithella sp.]|nr:TSUP family transporter [Smithella sp.]